MDPNAPATKADIAELRAELEERLKVLATKDDLAAFATKDDLAAFATKDDLAAFAARADLTFATKDELAAVERRLALEIASAANTVIETLTDRFRAGNDETRGVADRVTALEVQVAAHVSDPDLHRAPRRRRPG